MSIVKKLASIDHAISVAELALLLSLGKTVIYDMVRRRAIPCIRVGYTVRFDPHEIAEWLRERSQGFTKSEADQSSSARSRRNSTRTSPNRAEHDIAV